MPDVSAGPPPLLAIVGPSGSGKSSLVRDLARRGEVQVIATFTTRPRRPDEPRDCPDHRFVTEKEFAEFAQSGAFLATGGLPGLPYRYGLPKLCRRTGPMPAIVLRAFVASELARLVPRLLVYQIEDRPERIYPRLVERGTQGPEIRARIASRDFEISLGRRVCHRFFTNQTSLEVLVGAVSRAIEMDTTRPR